MTKQTARQTAATLAPLASNPAFSPAVVQACAAASNVLRELAAIAERPELAAGMDAATLARVLMDRAGLAYDLSPQDIRAQALAAGFELGQNLHANPGFYFHPVGQRDDAPRTFPTVAEAWADCREAHALELAERLAGA